jgi:membrane-associated progesterone receptor component
MYHAESDEEMDSSDGEEPMKFLVGEMDVVPAIEEAVVGMKIGEAVVIFVEPEDEDSHPVPEGRDESLVIDISADKLPDGATVGSTLSIGVERRPATVTKISKSTATLDLNDPLAGQRVKYHLKLASFDVDTTLTDEELFPEPEEVPSKVFSHAELVQYDGKQRSEIYVAVKGIVYDLSAGAAMYGPGGNYEVFAGRDASYALAKMSKNPQDLDRPTDNLSADAKAMLAHWLQTFQSKYRIVGRFEPR